MPINLAPYLPEPFDQRRVPAAFDSLISTIMQGRKMTQEQGQFDVEQERLRAGDAADAQYKQGLLSNEKARLGQADKHHKDTAAAKRREDQTKAAELIGKALSEGDEGVIVSMGPYLQALGIQAKVDQRAQDAVLVPNAFRDPSDMGFALGPRKLFFTADGQPMGDIDLDQLQQMQRAPSEKMLQALVAGASDTDKPAMHQMADAARAAGPSMMHDPNKTFDKVTGAAAQVTGMMRADERARQNRLQAEALADATRANQVNRYGNNYELARQRLIASRRDYYVNSAMTQGDQKGLGQNEHSARKALGWIDSALKSSKKLEAASKGRFAVSSAVTSMFGKNSSNKELQFIFSNNFQTEAENKFNYFASGGELAKDQLEAIRSVLLMGLTEIRTQRKRLAATAQSGISNDPTINGIAPEMAEDLARSAGWQVLGAGESASSDGDKPAAGMTTPGIPGSAVQNQADELREQDDDVDAEYNRLLGGDDARP